AVCCGACCWHRCSPAPPRRALAWPAWNRAWLSRSTVEVHAPYRQLAPGERMQAGERWTLLRYDGADQPAAQREFLCRQAPRLGLAHACGD
ncbi:hypothetical protein SB658_23460, partial [Bacillus sp. SIMBA_008]|uniref:hypothetical protein n=1 Tax=Bacillus sp. SIMBA_008 TaxID=3085757 RepID=UPI00397A1F06